MSALPYNKIPTIHQMPYAEELTEVIDMARAGHLPSLYLLNAFFGNLEKVLKPFGQDVFHAAEQFAETLQE